MKKCDICGGRRTIRLPVLQPLHVTDIAPTARSRDDGSREYPCPECGDVVRESRLGILQEVREFDAREGGEQYMDHVRRYAAHALIHRLLDDGYIAFEVGPEGPPGYATRKVRATLGVVGKGHVASLEDRIAERQADVSKEAALAAISNIQHWASNYGDKSISKDRACDFVREATVEALKRRAAWSPL